MRGVTVGIFLWFLWIEIKHWVTQDCQTLAK